MRSEQGTPRILSTFAHGNFHADQRRDQSCLLRGDLSTNARSCCLHCHPSCRAMDVLPSSFYPEHGVVDSRRCLSLRCLSVRPSGCPRRQSGLAWAEDADVRGTEFHMSAVPPPANTEEHRRWRKYPISAAQHNIIQRPNSFSADCMTSV